MTKKRNLIIMCGGLSSRLKNSLAESGVSEQIKTLVFQNHKSLLPLGKQKKPMLYYALKNAVKAAVSNVYIITAEQSPGFDRFLSEEAHRLAFSSLNITLVPQLIPKGEAKPLGTADAILQALEQQQNLREDAFIVINGDNLYSTKALKALYRLPQAQQALIGYNRKGLDYPVERLRKFAVVQCDETHALTHIDEKPSSENKTCFPTLQGNVLISMNAFKFYGPAIYPYLKNCPLNPIRKEKELPKAVVNYITDFPKSFFVLPLKEHVPDLTSAQDLEKLNEQMV
ncbi:MAG: sugar phosphate nucleotidyltransferase [Flavobacteriaceae bacterium]